MCEKNSARAEPRSAKPEPISPNTEKTVRPEVGGFGAGSTVHQPSQSGPPLAEASAETSPPQWESSPSPFVVKYLPVDLNLSATFPPGPGSIIQVFSVICAGMLAIGQFDGGNVMLVPATAMLKG